MAMMFLSLSFLLLLWHDLSYLGKDCHLRHQYTPTRNISNPFKSKYFSANNNVPNLQGGKILLKYVNSCNKPLHVCFMLADVFKDICDKQWWRDL